MEPLSVAGLGAPKHDHRGGSTFQEYAFTERRRALVPVIIALRDWGEQFLFPKGPALVVWAADGRPLSAGDALDHQ